MVDIVEEPLTWQQAETEIINIIKWVYETYWRALKNIPSPLAKETLTRLRYLRVTYRDLDIFRDAHCVYEACTVLIDAINGIQSVIPHDENALQLIKYLDRVVTIRQWTVHGYPLTAEDCFVHWDDLAGPTTYTCPRPINVPSIEEMANSLLRYRGYHPDVDLDPPPPLPEITLKIPPEYRKKKSKKKRHSSDDEYVYFRPPPPAPPPPPQIPAFMQQPLPQTYEPSQNQTSSNTNAPGAFDITQRGNMPYLQPNAGPQHGDGPATFGIWNVNNPYKPSLGAWSRSCWRDKPF